MTAVQRLTRRDWLFLAICIALFAISLGVTLTWFSRAFPEASIEFRYDRDSSLPIAERVLAAEKVGTRGARHTASFDGDDTAKTFLERTLGLDRASAIMRRDVRLWWWHHRWFRPSIEEEYATDVAPTGEVVGYSHHIPEDRATPPIDANAARTFAERFLATNHVSLADLQLVAQSERQLPHRVQRIFTWDSKSIHPAGAPYRSTVIVDGNVIGDYSTRIRVPDAWKRSYSELRSKNLLAGNIDLVFLAITMIAAVVVFVQRLRRGDMHLRFLLGIGAASIVLVTGVALNSFPEALAHYETTTSYAAFLGQFIFFALMQSIGTAMLLIVIGGVGEVMYREDAPQQLALPRLWTPRALGSKRVFRSFVLGYTLLAVFLAYQVVFYVVASKFGAWSPAEVPYDDLLNSALPWVAVLFAGFFPALSEEFLSRAFSIPFFSRVLRSRVAAIVVAGFIWGFGHATYPNQPFYIRGVEVGLAGVALGFLFNRFGLLPLLIWHYSVDALYSALLLFRSHNAYYVLSAAASSLIFAIPMLISIALYLKRGGFLPDDDLLNATLPLSPVPMRVERVDVAELPPPIRLVPRRVIACLIVVAIAVALVAIHPPSPEDAIDYRTPKAGAKAIATRHTAARTRTQFQRVIATPIEGFRSWDAHAGREDGGNVGGFDSIAASYLLAHGLSMEGLVNIFRTRIEAATWTVRFFTPSQKEEVFVEVDPRAARAIGYHRYQAENAPGPRLEQAQALAIARAAFAPYGLDVSRYQLKEALSFQQPSRRDWLFHFDEQPPIASEGYRRTSVRVAGADVTQFAITIKAPDSAYREASKQTLRNVMLIVMKIAGGIALLALVVGGFVVAVTRHRPRWSRALRWTLAMAIIPLAGIAASFETTLFEYNTSVRWETFRAGLAVDIARDAAMRIGILFLAFVIIDSALPYGFDLLRREARGRLGRSAAVAAITAIGLFTAVRVAMQLLASRFPAAANVSIDVPSLVAVPWPSLLAIGEALYDAVIGSAIVMAAVVTLRSIHKRAWIGDAIVVAAIFGASLDAGATAAQMPLMLLRSITQAVVVWGIGRFVLNGNALAWPLAIFLAITLQNAAALDQNRSDLRTNAIVILIAAIVAVVWIVVTPSASEGAGGAGGTLDEPMEATSPPRSLAKPERERSASGMGSV
jgi:membrane protease YdiL (CAAX protease family)